MSFIASWNGMESVNLDAIECVRMESNGASWDVKAVTLGKHTLVIAKGLTEDEAKSRVANPAS